MRAARDGHGAARRLHRPEFSTLLGLADLFPVEPIRDSARFYRRWAFESAALDLALRQNGLSLQDAVGRVAKPVTFVVSTGIGEPASLAPLRALLRVDPSLQRPRATVRAAIGAQLRPWPRGS
jgi:hypothetical protein